MKLNIRRVAVIGAGTMGSQIAGWLAQWFDVDLFDVQQGDVQVSQLAWEKLLERGAVFSAQDLLRIRPCTIGVDDKRLADANWIVEAVYEELKVKQGVFRLIDQHRRAEAIVSSNTSGLNIDEIVAGTSQDLRENTFVTHFFNPVAVLPLLEVCAGTATDPQLFTAFMEFGRDVLQKGVIEVFNTPNFIGNRLGVMAMQIPFFHWPKGMLVNDVDAVFQVLFGWKPLNTADIVGLQLLEPVASNVFDYEHLEPDPFLHYFHPIEFVERLVKLCHTGRNALNQRGFYAREGKQKFVFDFESNMYVPYLPEQPSNRYPSLSEASLLTQQGDAHKARQHLLQGPDAAAEFARNCFYPVLTYALWLVGKVCEDLLSIDKAMRWGFNWPIGPLQICEMIGRVAVIAGAEQVGYFTATAIPDWYREAGVHIYSTPQKPQSVRQSNGVWQSIPETEEIIDLEELRREDGGNIISQNNDATAYRLGDLDVVLVEFHSGVVNPFTLQCVDVLEDALNIAEADDLPVIVGHAHKKAFSAGANLLWLLEQAQAGNFAEIERFLVTAQDLTQRMTYARVPVVVAPHSLALGLGSELILASTRTVANFWLFQGQPEKDVGLVAAAGGCMRTLRNALEGIPFQVMTGAGWTVEVAWQFIKPVLLLHVMCARSKHAVHARDLGFLRCDDLIVHSRGLGQEHVLFRACQEALWLNGQQLYLPRKPFLFNLPGCSLSQPLAEGVIIALEVPFDSHSATIIRRLAYILCGGTTHLGRFVTEQDLLDLEREAFLSLVGTPETQALIAKIVKKS
ncbi:MAG: hypothetical protein A3B74_05190 [Candidatus Kerfeldbacteria bacterium RIFCSPHIGHO2_02_FULL_42_14]|uniref:3-hydroxyacyl-CoA dehydrogenase NAD binding domain-containing protein n=1 Tax=Candidatus Kerfeldbacteria bacterium RIFCSPHIGHO2_02_FULL_42_14 TaxID=1798540 RepID=A0A1G2ASY6_9BACT|nr:MAG: hypothetical protein A3B74_05190 [Candidatus Kerfeldbacteria bacterium RIFCSPHIGHO2_02_FULL_42_14]OGY81609.1 MAG: hypothetical protein A3E60_02060 [Candidatus Kerfeldbacteria bacterium RIFCSPHIGHO2_12_FULL_42_13]